MLPGKSINNIFLYKIINGVFVKSKNSLEMQEKILIFLVSSYISVLNENIFIYFPLQNYLFKNIRHYNSL